MRKLFYTAGALVALATPLIAVVSCSDKKHEQTNSPVVQSIKKDEPTDTPVVQSNDKQNITLEVRVPDWSHNVVFDENKFDKTKFIENWHMVSRTVNHVRSRVIEHSMVPFALAKQWTVPTTSAQTLGGLMDELNKTWDLFKFNMDLASAGAMGRFLSGIRKTDEAIAKEGASHTDNFWGIHHEANAQGDLIQTDDDHYTYISLSSPNNAMADQKSSDTFDHNESAYAFNGRLPKGVDGITLNSNDVIDLNLWRMM